MPQFIGRILAVESGFAVQSLGRGKQHKHSMTDLEREVFAGEFLKITYRSSVLAKVEVLKPPTRDCPEHDIAQELWEQSRNASELQR